MGRLLGLTGTPGTGKKSIAPRVSKRLGLTCVSINEIALARNKSAGRGKEVEVDTRAVRRALLKKECGPCVVYGHLLPDVLVRRDVARVVVLRCDPAVLKRRLLARGYSREKTTENVEAELIGLVSSNSLARFGEDKTEEYDTTASSAAKSAVEVAKLLAAPHRRVQRIDWLGDYGSAAKFRSLFSTERTESART